MLSQGNAADMRRGVSGWLCAAEEQMSETESPKEVPVKIYKKQYKEKTT